MSPASYPAMITNLPRVDLPLEGVTGWLLQATKQQVVFFEIQAGCSVPPHSHGEQWGIVVEGKMDLTIEGRTRRCQPGDSYHIPAGAVHGARFLTRFRAIDVFADADRYKAKP